MCVLLRLTLCFDFAGFCPWGGGGREQGVQVVISCHTFGSGNKECGVLFLQFVPLILRNALRFYGIIAPHPLLTQD